MIPDTVTISKEEYRRLMEDHVKLTTLMGFGIDNTTAYQEAMEYLHAEEDDEVH